MDCNNCKAPLGTADNFCVECGTKVQVPELSDSPTIEFAPISQDVIEKDIATKNVIKETERQITQAQDQVGAETIAIDGITDTQIDVVVLDTAQQVVGMGAMAVPKQTVIEKQTIEEPATMPLPDIQPKDLQDTDPTEQPKEQTEEQSKEQPVEEIKENVQIPAIDDELSKNTLKSQPAPVVEKIEPEIIELPKSLSPLPTFQYVLYFLLMAIPIVNIVVALVWSFNTQINANRRNMARASLLMIAIVLCIMIILLSMGIYLLINSPQIVTDFLGMF